MLLVSVVVPRYLATTTHEFPNHSRHLLAIADIRYVLPENNMISVSMNLTYRNGLLILIVFGPIT